MRTCPSCQRDWPEDRFNPKFDDCFACRSKGVSVAFQGGKEHFHSTTIKSEYEKAMAEGRKNGYEPVPAWTKTNAGFATSSQEAKLKQAISPETKKA